MLDSIIDNFRVGLESFVNGAGNWLSEHAANIVFILIVGFFARIFLARFVSKLIKKTVRHDLFPTEKDRRQRVETLDELIGAIVKIGVWLVVFAMIISELGVDTGPLIASAGVLGVALGFGAQSLIKDFTSGIFIISEDQYRVGDIIKIAGVWGTVKGVTIRTTILQDFDGSFHYVPNGIIDVTTNMTHEVSFLYEEFTVGLNTDIDQLEHIVNHVGKQLAQNSEFKHVIKKAPALLRVAGFNDSGLIVKVGGEIQAGEQWRVQGEFYKLLKKAFDKHGINIPYPQLTINDPKLTHKK